MNLSDGSRVLLCCFLAIAKDTFGQIKPSNAVAAVGGQAIFNCSGSSFLPNWFMSKDGTATNQLPIAGSCNVNINLQNHYKTEPIGGATNCNLVVFDVTMEQAGTYWCTDSANSYALLTVIESSPVITVNSTTSIVENESVVIECTLNHNGSVIPAPTLQPYFYWTNSIGKNISSFNDSTTNDTAVSQITVVAGRQNITAYTCHVYLQLIPAPQPNYASNTPALSSSSSSSVIEVLYYPGNISITSSVSAEYNCVYKQESLKCTADSNPTAQYEWLDLNSNNVTSGSVKYITSGGRYQCTAYNDIRNQRHNETKTATETSCYSVKQDNMTIHGPSCTNGTCYCIGDQMVTLTCLAYSIPGPTYQWLSDVPDHTHLGSNNTIRATYDGNYSCRATNKYGEVINNGTVSVIVSNCRKTSSLAWIIVPVYIGVCCILGFVCFPIHYMISKRKSAYNARFPFLEKMLPCMNKGTNANATLGGNFGWPIVYVVMVTFVGLFAIPVMFFTVHCSKPVLKVDPNGANQGESLPTQQLKGKSSSNYKEEVHL